MLLKFIPKLGWQVLETSSSKLCIMQVLTSLIQHEGHNLHHLGQLQQQEGPLLLRHRHVGQHDGPLLPRRRHVGQHDAPNPPRRRHVGQLLQQHCYQEVLSPPLQCQGHRQGKISFKSETVLGHNLIFLRWCNFPEDEDAKGAVTRKVITEKGTYAHPHHQQGDGRVHHAHLLQHCSPEPVPEHHASRPVLSIRISVLRLQKLNNMQTKSCRISNASAEKSRVGLQKPTVDLDGPKHHLLLALHDGHHHLAHMKQELLSQCCTQQAGLSTCMMWPNYTLSTLTTTSMVMCYMTAKGANKLALVRESKKETHKVEVAEIDATVSNGAGAVILKLYNMQVSIYATGVIWHSPYICVKIQVLKIPVNIHSLFLYG